MKLFGNILILFLFLIMSNLSYSEYHNVDTPEVQIKKLKYVLNETFKGLGMGKVDFFVSKLKDQQFTGMYSHGYTWYYASENLGKIGKEAIPKLIKILDTKNDFERTQALYALSLAAQHPNVKSFTNGEYVKGDGTAFPEPEKHSEIVDEWKKWFNKYKNDF